MRHRLYAVLVVLAVVALTGAAVAAPDSPTADESALAEVGSETSAMSESPQEGVEAPATPETPLDGQALPWLLPEPEPVHHCNDIVSSWCDPCPGGIRWCYKDNCGVTHCGSCGSFC